MVAFVQSKGTKRYHVGFATGSFKLLGGGERLYFEMRRANKHKLSKSPNIKTPTWTVSQTKLL